MKIAYFGSPKFSADLLKLLLNDEAIEISLIVSSGDKPAGKKLEMTSTPVKKLAQENAILYLDNLKENFEEKLKQTISTHKIELGIVFAYGQFISESILDSFKYGIWNIHPSLLPKYRGPSPIAFPILIGDAKTGSTLIQLNSHLDQGDIIDQTTINIKDSETKTDLENKLIPVFASQIHNNIEKLILNGRVEHCEQVHAQATYTRLLKKYDGYMYPNLLKKARMGEKITLEEMPDILKDYLEKYPSKHMPNSYDAASIINNMYRALSPWPGIWTKIKTNQGEKRLKLISISFNNKILVIERVQLEGKKIVEFSIFKKAYNVDW